MDLVEQKEKVESFLKEENLNELFKYFKNLCLPITYKYLKIFKNDYYLTDDEVYSLCLRAFDNFLKYREVKEIYDYERYFKYLYLQVINAELRKLNEEKHRVHRRSLENSEDFNIEDSIYFSQSSNCFDNMNDEIVSYILESNKSGLSQREKEILSYYVNGYNIREISEIIGLCYSSCFREVESLIEKCRKFLLNTIPDLFY